MSCTSHASRASRSATVALGFLLATWSTSAAQSTAIGRTTSASAENGWELLLSSGALVPTGAQRKTIKDAQISTGQLSYVMASRVAITSTLGWARSRDLVTEGNPRLSVFTYDVGVEMRAPHWRGDEARSLTPFAGVGAGGRSFNHRGVDLAATHVPTAYASLGGELAIGRARMRLEARDYLTRMTPLVGGGKRVARNDVIILAGFRFARKTETTN